MSDDSYEAILSRSVEDIPEPVLLPAGSWVLKATSAAKFVPPKSETDTPVVLFVYEPTEDLDDVDKDAVQELRDADYDFGNNPLFYRIRINRESDWKKVVEHIKLHGVDTEGLTVKESLAAVKSARIIGAVTVRSYTKKPEGTLVTTNDVAQFAALED